MANTSGSSWKEPLPDYLEHLYWKRFKREAPEKVNTIEELAKREMAKREARKEAKAHTENN